MIRKGSIFAGVSPHGFAPVGPEISNPNRMYAGVSSPLRIHTLGQIVISLQNLNFVFPNEIRRFCKASRVVQRKRATIVFDDRSCAVYITRSLSFHYDYPSEILPCNKPIAVIWTKVEFRVDEPLLIHRAISYTFIVAKDYLPDVLEGQGKLSQLCLT